MRGLQQRFTVQGLNVERLIRRAGEQGIHLHGLRREGRMLTGTAGQTELAMLEELAQQGGWRFERGERLGIGKAAEKMKGRWFALCAAWIVLSLSVLCTQVMWRVELRDAGRYAADAAAYLEQIGVSAPCRKASIDPAAVRDALEWRYPDVAWVECGWRGMTLHINFVIGNAAGEAHSLAGQSDVLAQRDGVIERVITLAGTPTVKAGDLVKRGDTLIRGEERAADGGVRPVSARGKVFARVWERAEIHYPLVETVTEYTGAQTLRTVPALPWFALWSDREPVYEAEDVSVREIPLGGLFVPFTLRQHTHMEVSLSRVKREEEAARAEAGEAALRELKKKCAPGDSLLTKWVYYSMMDDEILYAAAIGERVIDIAAQ